MIRRAKLLALLLAFPLLASALDSDREQPIHVRADHAEMNRTTGVSLYRGDVLIDQGSLHIEADWVRVHHPNNELERIEAEGQPVHFRQRPEGARDDVRGKSLRLDYHVKDDRIELQGQAQVEQAGDRFSGETIHYDMANSRVKADSRGLEDGRIHAIIQPRSKDEETP